MNSFLDEMAKVSGMVTKGRDGQLYITVSSFKVFETPEEYYDHDDDDGFYDDRYDDKYEDFNH